VDEGLALMSEALGASSSRPDRARLGGQS